LAPPVLQQHYQKKLSSVQGQSSFIQFAICLNLPAKDKFVSFPLKLMSREFHFISNYSVEVKEALHRH
jgi:hypothetical protein